MLTLRKLRVNYVIMQHIWVTVRLKLSDVSGHVVCLIIWVSEEWVVQMVWVNIQGVPGGMDKTSGECSLC